MQHLTDAAAVTNQPASAAHDAEMIRAAPESTNELNCLSEQAKNNALRGREAGRFHARPRTDPPLGTKGD